VKRLRKQLIGLFFLLVTLILVVNSASAATKTINASKIIKMSGQTLDPQENPDISGNITVYRKTVYPGTPYWAEEDPIVSQIVWKNLATGQKGTVSSTTGNYDPRISGNIVVWQHIASGQSSILWKNIATGNSGKVSGNYKAYNPDLSGTKVVWEQEIGKYQYIYWKDLATGAGGRLSALSTTSYDPAISGNKVVWEQWTGSKFNIKYKNLATGTMSTLSSGMNSDISGNLVVWQTDNAIIYYKNWGNGHIYKVCPGLYQYRPRISGSIVVWEDYTSGKLSVKWKNLSTGKVGLANWQNSDSQFGYEPAISGNIVVWQDWKEHPFYVYWKNIFTGKGGRIQH